MQRRRLFLWLLLTILLAGVMLLCVCVGSVLIPLGDTLRVLGQASCSQKGAGVTESIILSVRLPRVLCVALEGASLSLCGCAMQGLLRNPLADGSTLGVSSGASLGAALAILFGFTLPGFPLSGTMVLAMLFAFLSLVLLLGLSWALDRSMSTNSIILIGVIFSMFVSSLMSLLVTFAGDRLRTITFWTMGSLAAANYGSAAVLAGMLVLCGGALLANAGALNAFTLGEAQALHLGVAVKRVKLCVMICVSMLVGVCVAIGGCIGFVGLVTPHMLRLLLGSDHRRLMPASMLGGACFLLLCDLAARTVVRPVELPIGVVTSIIGAVVFVVIFARTRRGRA